MKILLTGATGYIGARLLPLLLEAGHEVVALVRSKREPLPAGVTTIVADLTDSATLEQIPEDIDAAYYLVHSMGEVSSGFGEIEECCAHHFINALERTKARQIVYLGGLGSGEQLSEHLSSRRLVSEILSRGKSALTTLQAGIIIGSGSASFEIIRDLVEKLPLMVTPRWVRSSCQPIAISDLLYYLSNVLGRDECYGKTYDIGGPDVLTYKEMMQQFAKLRGLRRHFIEVPVLTPRLSSYWLYFVTSTNFSLAKALVESLKVDAVCQEEGIRDVLPHTCISYRESIEKAFAKIEQNAVLSSWKDAMAGAPLPRHLQELVEIPKYGCLSDFQKEPLEASKEAVIKKIWEIGGRNGWYAFNWAWKLRGIIDKIFGGVGLQRGRRDSADLRIGDALDFWRVILSDHERGRLILYAEMKLPGEAWLEWKIEDGYLEQRATFRPKGLLGRLYWFGLLPFHLLIFKRMCKALVKGEKS